MGLYLMQLSVPSCQLIYHWIWMHCTMQFTLMFKIIKRIYQIE